MKKPKLGDLARDIITGFSGVIVSHTRWLTGCDVYGLSPQKLKDGSPVATQHFDVDRIEVVKRGAFKPTTGKTIREARTTGGPASCDSYPQR